MEDFYIYYDFQQKNTIEKNKPIFYLFCSNKQIKEQFEKFQKFLKIWII